MQKFTRRSIAALAAGLAVVALTPDELLARGRGGGGRGGRGGSRGGRGGRRGRRGGRGRDNKDKKDSLGQMQKDASEDSRGDFIYDARDRALTNGRDGSRRGASRSERDAAARRRRAATRGGSAPL